MSASPTTAVATDFSGFAALRASARANDPVALKKAAQQFEAMMTQQLLKSARAASLSEGDVLGGGQTAYYQDLFDQQMALHLSTNGKGLGLADVLVRQVGGAVKGGAAAEADAIVAPSRRWSTAYASAMPSSAAGAASSAGDAAVSPEAADFVAKVRPYAERAAKALGVPAHVIIAQAAVETGWGRHVPKNDDGSSSFNLFGVKATGSWSGGAVDATTREHLDGRLQKVSASFRSYGSLAEAFDDYVKTLKSNPRYAEALRNGATADGFANGLQKAGYATDPDYAGKLLDVAHGPTMTTALADDGSSTAKKSWTA